MRKPKFFKTKTEQGESLLIGVVDEKYEFWIYGKTEGRMRVKYRLLDTPGNFTWLVASKSEDPIGFWEFFAATMAEETLLDHIASVVVILGNKKG